MEVGPRGHAGRADEADNVPFADWLAGRHVDLRQMAIAGLQRAWVIECHEQTVASLPTRCAYRAVRGREDRCASGGRQVNAAMRSKSAQKRVPAVAEAAGHGCRIQWQLAGQGDG